MQHYHQVGSDVFLLIVQAKYLMLQFYVVILLSSQVLC